jgi:hypothetical protein
MSYKCFDVQVYDKTGKLDETALRELLAPLLEGKFEWDLQRNEFDEDLANVCADDA